MAVSFKQAHLLAEELTTIPDCPRSEGAVEAIAKDLFRLCRNDDEAQMAVDAAREQWTAWKGTAGLIEVLQSMRRGPESLPPERRVIDLGPKPVVNCAACQDWGYIWRGGRNEWCSCAEGVRMQNESSDFLEKLNTKHVKGPQMLQAMQASPERRPITEADLEQAYLQRKKDAEGMIARAKAVLADETRSSNEKELARETLRTLGVEE